ncbi:helix-turn-helix transcriptional regulator [Parafrigoribacterium soli]|uniref:helix-turn-helix transcriptional regulator n=1 Tax=Parafrigoribacterium soli TaxID=3144663 RepID=UPI0032EFF8AC
MRPAAVSPFIVGREGELALLREALQESIGGGTRTVVLSGEAGIGKSRVIDDFLAELPSGTILLRGQSVDLGRDAPPYAPIVEPLRTLVREFGEQTVSTAAGPAHDTLGVLLPELANPSASVGQNSRDLLFDAVASLFENVSVDHPLVLVIEDLHWSDPAAVGLLRFLVRVLERARMLFVFTFRSDEVRSGHPLHGWLPELDRNRRVERRELSRLGRRQLRQLVTALTGSGPSARELAIIAQRTDGVPFFVEELVGLDCFGEEDLVPTNLRGILLARYEPLSDPTKRMLRLLAAGGNRVEHALLTAVSASTADEIDAAAREAVEASVLVVDGTNYGFRHALVREAIHEELLPGERVRFHSDYALALERAASGREPDASEVSYHWMAAHDLPRAFAASLKAMAQARSTFAFVTAARMGERAIELWEQVPDAESIAGISRVELLSRTAYILRNTGESDRALAIIDIALAESTPADVEPYALMLRNKASFLANVGREGSIELLGQALELLRGEEASVLRANVLGELASRYMLAAQFGRAIELADEAFAEAQGVGSRDRMSVAANIRGISRVSSGDVEHGLADLELAGELAVGNDSARLRFWVNKSDAMQLLGRFGDAVALAETGLERARQRGVERTSGVMLMSNVIEPLFALGEVQRATDLLDRAMELDSPIGFNIHLQRLRLLMTLWGGDPDLAARLLEGWRAGLGLQMRIDTQSRLGIARAAAEIALERGDAPGAWDEARIVLDPDHHAYPPYDLPLLVVAARTLAALTLAGAKPTDDHGEAMAFSDAEAALRRVLELSASWPTAPAYLALFEAELGGTGRDGSDSELWRVAVEATRVSTIPVQWMPYAQFRRATALMARGDRVAAQASAEAARSRAAEVGAQLIVNRTMELENRAGLTMVGRHPSDGRQRLTERERQVLALIGEGLSNRQIAERLFISVKTASVHVSAILRKTGAASRTEAVFLASGGQSAQ